MATRKAPAAPSRASVSKAFRIALARPVLNRLATIPIFQQGQELFLHQHLTGVIVESDEAAAHVQDGEPFLARLWMEDGFLQYECPCTRGQQGLLCAHAVAVALAALEGKPAEGKAKAKPKTIDLAQTDKVLREQSSDTLAGLLLNWAQQDDRLLHSLMSFAAQQGGFALDLKAYRIALKKRLKKPRRGATAADYRHYAKSISVELEQISGLITQGQSYAALELAAEVVQFLLTFHSYDGNGVDVVLDLVPQAFDIFVRAGRQSRAEPKVLIPHLLAFYGQDIDAELDDDPDRKLEGLEACGELLGVEGRLALARAAEVLVVDPREVAWEARAMSVRMLKLCQSVYLANRDFDGVERVISAFGTDDFREALAFARLLLQHAEPRRALDFLERAKATLRKRPSHETFWLLAEAHLQLGDPTAAFVAALPILESHRPEELEELRHFAVDHACWPQWREFLLAEKPPGKPPAEHRHHWRFQLHILEKNFADAWPIAVWHQMDPALAGQCALEMKDTDPVHAARVLTGSAETLLQSDRTIMKAITYLDAAAQLVIDQGMRPDQLAAILRASQRRLGIYGNSHLVKIREPLWNKAIGLLTAPKLTIVR